MTSKDIAGALAARHGIGKTEARERLTAVLESTAETIAGGGVPHSGFGRLTTNRQRARQGRTPWTVEALVMGPSTRIAFKPSKALKDRLAN